MWGPLTRGTTHVSRGSPSVLFACQSLKHPRNRFRFGPRIFRQHLDKWSWCPRVTQSIILYYYTSLWIADIITTLEECTGILVMKETHSFGWWTFGGFLLPSHWTESWNLHIQCNNPEIPCLPRGTEEWTMECTIWVHALLMTHLQ